MKIYWTKQQKPNSRNLAASALKLYCGISDVLCYNKDGKPYFKNSNIKISISHSSGIWICVLGRYEAGIDIEAITDREYIKIANRFFTEDEKHFVLNNGAEDFFKLWVRKEAYVKYIGRGISYGLDRFDLSDGNVLKDIYDNVLFKDIDFGKEFKCAICTEKEALAWKQIKIEEMHI